jgi:hypothetical protein
MFDKEWARLKDLSVERCQQGIRAKPVTVAGWLDSHELKTGAVTMTAPRPIIFRRIW